MDRSQRLSPRTAVLREAAVTGLRNLFDALERLAGGLVTAVLALATATALLIVAVTGPLGIGLLLLPSVLKLVRTVADRERDRLSRWGVDVLHPYTRFPAGPVDSLRSMVHDPATRRDLAWLLAHASLGFLLGLLGVLLPVFAVRDLSFPLWWWLLPREDAGAAIGIPVNDWPAAFAVSLMGLGWGAVVFGLGPLIARAQSWPGRKLLGPPAGTDLTQRIAELTSTRAAGLHAHAVELRRIERSLHDGAQNRLVGVTVLIGAARRALQNDPARADAALERAQTITEEALAELRVVVRAILPPMIADRGLDGALEALAAACSVPCEVDVEPIGRCPASIESTAYFVVAEALTNVTRHSGAGRAEVAVRREGDRLVVLVHDDGRGGAHEAAGTGILGIRQRVEAHDGTVRVLSPEGGPTTITAELPCGL
ncbi:sensor histidine kinase [Nocardiopsis ansamitocini]|uniref:histidine kinase n=1 Tax=Nocardiopsis ansamitocini TaxID=1670832 RepID=A0A9W6P8S1_9ACTN|nr:sensor histidine kinase [Nocardiopsis ansamitocini]GLU49122.1 histidine kinase [Nocardiopsis ansamitocini]